MIERNTHGEFKKGRAVRKEVRKQLVAFFEDALSRRVPGFTRDREAVVPSGWLVYRRKGKAPLTFYLMLVVHSMRDSFTLEGAWSTNGSFPGSAGLRGPRDVRPLGSKGSERDQEFRFRATRLWEAKEYWWDFVPRMSFSEQFENDACDMEEPSIAEALGKVRGCVNTAVDKIVEHVIPFFDDVCGAVDGERE